MSREQLDFDVGIVGASLAGSTAALACSKLGKKVILFDSARFPRRKPCGEGLSAKGYHELRSLLGEESSFPSHSTLQGYSLFPEEDGSQRQSKPTLLTLQEQMAIRGIERRQLDSHLLDYAKCNLEFLNQKVRTLEQTEETVTVSTDTSRIRCRMLILATGISRTLPKQCGLPEYKSISSRSFLRYGASISCRIDKPLSTVMIFPQSTGEFFFTPLGTGLCNISLLGSKVLVQDFLNPEFRQRLLEKMRVCCDSNLVELDEPIVSGPFGRRSRRSGNGRIFFVGDAAEVLDPIGGMGMTQAILSGKLAGTLLGGASLGDSNRLLARYDYERERLSFPLRTFGGFVHSLIHSRRGKFAQAHLNQMPLLRAWIFQRTVSVIHGAPNSLETRLGSRMLDTLSSLLAKERHENHSE